MVRVNPGAFQHPRWPGVCDGAAGRLGDQVASVGTLARAAPGIADTIAATAALNQRLRGPLRAIIMLLASTASHRWRSDGVCDVEFAPQDGRGIGIPVRFSHLARNGPTYVGRSRRWSVADLLLIPRDGPRPVGVPKPVLRRRPVFSPITLCRAQTTSTRRARARVARGGTDTAACGGRCP